MSETAKAHLCPVCKGVGQIIEFCMEYAPHPGTTWEMIHDTSTGASWCFHCGKPYNSHGAPSDVATQLGVRERDRHLVCPSPTGPCAREAGHDGDHVDEWKRSWSSSMPMPAFKPPEIKPPLVRVHAGGSGARGALRAGVTDLTPIAASTTLKTGPAQGPRSDQ